MPYQKRRRLSQAQGGGQAGCGFRQSARVSFWEGLVGIGPRALFTAGMARGAGREVGVQPTFAGVGLRLVQRGLGHVRLASWTSLCLFLDYILAGCFSPTHADRNEAIVPHAVGRVRPPGPAPEAGVGGRARRWHCHLHAAAARFEPVCSGGRQNLS